METGPDLRQFHSCVQVSDCRCCDGEQTLVSWMFGVWIARWPVGIAKPHACAQSRFYVLFCDVPTALFALGQSDRSYGHAVSQGSPKHKLRRLRRPARGFWFRVQSKRHKYTIGDETQRHSDRRLRARHDMVCHVMSLHDMRDMHGVRKTNDVT